MSKMRINVPAGMLKAACTANDEYSDEGTNRRVLEAALLWLSENPIIPNEDQALSIVSSKKPSIMNSLDNWEVARWGAVEWQRRMFLAPDEDENMSKYDENTYGGLLERIKDGVPLTERQQKKMAECGLTVEDFKPRKSYVGEAIRDLLSTGPAIDDYSGDQLNTRLREAYRRGRKDR